MHACIKPRDNAAFDGRPQGYRIGKSTGVTALTAASQPENAGSMAVSWPLATNSHAIVVTLPRS
jgi:hypothetical protein